MPGVGRRPRSAAHAPTAGRRVRNGTLGVVVCLNAAFTPSHSIQVYPAIVRFIQCALAAVSIALRVPPALYQIQREQVLFGAHHTFFSSTLVAARVWFAGVVACRVRRTHRQRILHTVQSIQLDGNQHQQQQQEQRRPCQRCRRCGQSSAHACEWLASQQHRFVDAEQQPADDGQSQEGAAQQTHTPARVRCGRRQRNSIVRCLNRRCLFVTLCVCSGRTMPSIPTIAHSTSISSSTTTSTTTDSTDAASKPADVHIADSHAAVPAWCAGLLDDVGYLIRMQELEAAGVSAEKLGPVPVSGVVIGRITRYHTTTTTNKAIVGSTALG